jgi:hypothetical protein
MYEEKSKMNERLTPKTTLYLGVLAILGVVSLAAITLNYPPRLRLGFFVLLAFAALTSFFRIQIRSGWEIPLSTVVVFGALLYLGPAEAVWTASLNAFFSLRAGTGWRTSQRILFNLFSLPVAAAAAASVYTCFGWNQWPFSLEKSFLPACVAASVFLCIHAGLIGGIVSLLEQEAFVSASNKILLPLLPTTFTGMTFAVILSVLAVEYGTAGLLAPLPLLVLIHISMNSPSGRASIPVR